MRRALLLGVLGFCVLAGGEQVGPAGAAVLYENNRIISRFVRD